MARKGLNIYKRKDGRWEARYIKSRNTQGKPRYGYSGSEQGGIRPAIVVQNDDGNFYSNVLLVVPLTTQIKKRNMPTHFILLWKTAAVLLFPCLAHQPLFFNTVANELKSY